MQSTVQWYPSTVSPIKSGYVVIADQYHSTICWYDRPHDRWIGPQGDLWAYLPEPERPKW